MIITSPQSSLDESSLDPADNESDGVPENNRELKIRLLVVGILLDYISSICEFDSEPSPSEFMPYRVRLRECFVFLTNKYIRILKHLSIYLGTEDQTFTYGSDKIKLYETKKKSGEESQAHQQFQLFHKFCLILNEELEEIKQVMKEQFERLCELIKTETECSQDEAYQPNSGLVRRNEKYDEYRRKGAGDMDISNYS